MARELQSRLALASYKTQRGWENLDLDTIEPRVDQDLMRKRMQAIQEGRTISPPHQQLSNSSSNGDSNDSNGNMMGSNNFNNNNIRRRLSNGSSSNAASPAHRKKRARTAAPFGDHTRGGLYVQHGMEDQDVDVDMIYEPAARHSFRNHSKNRAWKESHRLPQSSPGYHHHHHNNSSFDMDSQPQFSFAGSPTRKGSPTLDMSHSRHHSHHYHHQDYEPQPVFHSSPPRTPPHRTIPARPVFTTAGEKLEERSNRGNSNGNSGKADGEGADLLLYLATSPSPNTMTKTNVSVAPSTPPSKGSAAALPSSMMNTPGGGGGAGGSFNFHDFVHITPSPAQGMWANGASGRTPMTMQARRRLNFDGLVPPSPMNGSQGSQGSQGKVTGLGMELGGELVSPTSGL